MPHYMSQDNPRFNAALRDEYSMYAQLHDEEINGRHSCMFVIIPTYIWLFFIHDSSITHAGTRQLLISFANLGTVARAACHATIRWVQSSWSNGHVPAPVQ